MRYLSACLLILISCCCVANPVPSSATETGLKAVGFRTGFSATRKQDFFHQHEAFAVIGLPWEWRTDSGWGVAVRLNAAAGMLYGGEKTSFITSLGPGLSFDKGDKGFALELGPNGVFVEKHRFGEQEFGGNFLYMAFISATYRFDAGPGVGYRFQHMSNGGTYGHGNPGLDLHMFGISWNFD